MPAGTLHTGDLIILTKAALTEEGTRVLSNVINDHLGNKMRVQDSNSGLSVPKALMGHCFQEPLGGLFSLSSDVS